MRQYTHLFQHKSEQSLGCVSHSHRGWLQFLLILHTYGLARLPLYKKHHHHHHHSASALEKRFISQEKAKDKNKK
jgi:hypothetical protein